MVVTSPTDRWMRDNLGECIETLTLASPYVGMYLPRLVGSLNSSVTVTLLTRTLLSDFASGSSDLNAVIDIASRCGGVLSLSSLHAKAYVIDERIALVTSANATFSGMHLNRECGIATTEVATVKNIARQILSGFGASPTPRRWSATELEALRAPVEALRAAFPKNVRRHAEAPDAPPVINLGRSQFADMTVMLPGWLKLTVEGISTIKSNLFTMEQVFQTCAPMVAKHYPENKHVRQKLRQQMQRLRDLGFVQFLGQGQYKWLISFDSRRLHGSR